MKIKFYNDYIFPKLTILEIIPCVVKVHTAEHNNQAIIVRNLNKLRVITKYFIRYDRFVLDDHIVDTNLIETE